MWTVVYIAPNRPVAEMLKELLEKKDPGSVNSLGVPHLGASASVEIRVPESEVEEAHDITSALG